MEEYDPKIVVFACRSDQYKEVSQRNIRLIEEKCIGCVDPQSLLLELKKGADGVLILGCPPDECRSAEKNREAFNRFILLQRLLYDLSISKGRIRFERVKELDEGEFTEIVAEMTTELKSLGPFRWENEG